MSSPAVAVIVPVFNRARLVVEALDSIATQTRPPHRLIVIDDGSTDGSAAVITQWLARAKLPYHAGLLKQNNLGAAAARNRGIDAAQGCDWLAFLDSDDLWPRDYLARMIDAAGAEPSAVAFTSDHVLHDVAAGTFTAAPSSFDGRITETILNGVLPLPSCTVARTDAVHRGGKFNTIYRQGLEDVELFLRMSLLGDWRSVPGAPVTRRIATRLSHGGPDQLSMQHLSRADSARAVLDLFDRFLFKLGGAGAVDAAAWTQKFLTQWRQFAFAALERGDHAEAITCVNRILARTDAFEDVSRPKMVERWRRMAKAAEDARDWSTAARRWRECWRFDRRSLKPLLRGAMMRIRSVMSRRK